MTRLSLFTPKALLPVLAHPERAEAGWQDWTSRLTKMAGSGRAEKLAEQSKDPEIQRLLGAIFAYSPFLSRCLLHDIELFEAVLRHGPEKLIEETLDRLKAELRDHTEVSAVETDLRRAKQKVALIVALADLAGNWSLDQVTAALSRFADQAISQALAFLLCRAANRQELALPNPEVPNEGCGYVILGLGKLGAGELNYSSDVDLIAIFDPENAPYTGSRSCQDFFVRLTRDLVKLLSERTAQGYVFRTDLRLRPDPAAMPLAISITAAETYYESLGQNWERAAMIKARPVAGDPALGREVMAILRPFVWRRNLDFWAIQDIHSIKRQINAQRGGGEVAILGHNVKLGRGGIREIEFFAQTQQLIYGGRAPALRQPRTVDALAALVEAGRLEAETAKDLSAAYRYLRRLEHRLQMVADQQTHQLPTDPEQLEALAAFLGYDDPETFRQELLSRLRCVEEHYAALFEEAPALSGPGNLVFTGNEPDPDTVSTLEGMGFSAGDQVIHLISGWHHGRYRATRSKRSREILTEIMPTLLESLAATAQPDQALRRFDTFLKGLPAGVQLFSMLHANPGLLRMLAGIMGSAPALAEQLSRRPGLLDAVLSPDFLEPLPDAEALEPQLAMALREGRDFQDILELSRRWANDRKFQVGVHLLDRISEADDCATALTAIAETTMKGLFPAVLAEFASVHGTLPGDGLAVIAFGKLGGREMTVTSDLDLVFLYDGPEDSTLSDGAKSLPPSVYYARLAQRFINALSAPTGEGRLYEIDMRLRPSGNAGPIATTLPGFVKYQRAQAWTWEHMALTRARAIIGTAEFTGRVQTAISDLLASERDPDTLVRDIAEMRVRVAREHRSRGPWDVKQRPGGLVDLEFLVQYWQLRHGHEHPEVLDPSTSAALQKLAAAGILKPDRAKALDHAARLLRHLQAILRLTVGQDFDEAQAPEGLKVRLAAAGNCADFAALKDRLDAATSQIHNVFREVIEDPGGHVVRDETAGED